MSATGILLAFERQINSWVDTPRKIAAPAAGSAPISLDSALQSLATSGLGLPSELVLHNAAGKTIEARYGRERTVLLDPWTGAVAGQASTSSRAFFESVERIHRSLGLGMQNKLGRGVIGAANFGFLLMLLSGLLLWIPKTSSSTGLRSRLWFRGGLTGRAREWNWHHVLGIWTLIPLLFIVLSGVIMSYPWASNLLFTLTGSQPPARNERRPGPGPATGQVDKRGETPALANARTLDELTAIARAQNPQWETITIEVPKPQDRTVQLTIDKSVGGQPEQASQLSIDRQSGRIARARLFSQNSTGQKLRAWARFLHTGEELGLMGQMIAALASLGAVLLVWTGLSLTWRRAVARFRSSQATPSQTQTVA